MFAAAARFDKAIEINSRPERLDPPKRLLRLAVEAGCRVSIDSDAHAPGQLAWLVNGCERAFLCGVEPESIVNTMAADDLAGVGALACAEPWLARVLHRSAAARHSDLPTRIKENDRCPLPR